MGAWEELLARPGLILADGGMGTMLMELGLQFGASPELWNVEQPDRVGLVHRGYLQAGSRVILTNTFGCNRLRLGLHNLQERVVEFNTAAAKLVREEVRQAGGAGRGGRRHRPQRRHPGPAGRTGAGRGDGGLC